MKEGYKKTELGWIPEEWDVSNLSDIAEINPKKEVLYNEKEVSFIAMEHISNAGRVINKETRNYGEVSKGYTAFKDEDVLLAKITPCFENGKKAIVRNLKNGYGFGSTEFHVLRSKDERSIPEFLYYYVSTNKFRQQAELNMTGSAGQKRVPTIFLNDNKLVVPPLKEQQKIAEILSTVDSQIDDTDKLIEKTKELKKGLMQRLLTKGIGHKEFKMTEIGEIPVEWEVKPLGKVFKLSSGEFLSQKNIIEGSYPVYGGNGITGYHNEFKHKEPKIVIGRVGAKCGCVCKSMKESWITDNALYINEKLCEFDDEFMLYLLSYLNLNKFANQNAQPVISGQKIYGINIGVPNFEEQELIANILSSVDTQIEEYENKKLKLEELKKGLMQQLLTGRIRVNNL